MLLRPSYLLSAPPPLPSPPSLPPPQLKALERCVCVCIGERVCTCCTCVTRSLTVIFTLEALEAVTLTVYLSTVATIKH